MCWKNQHFYTYLYSFFSLTQNLIVSVGKWKYYKIKKKHIPQNGICKWKIWKIKKAEIIIFFKWSWKAIRGCDFIKLFENLFVEFCIIILKFNWKFVEILRYYFGKHIKSWRIFNVLWRNIFWVSLYLNTYYTSL